MVLRQVEAAASFLLLFVIGQALLAHYYRLRLSPRLRMVVFVPWALGLGMFVVQKLMFR